MKTSVILCTYNGKEYILEQLDSLKNQSLQPDEVIITDDKSTDETATIIKDYIKQYKLDNWKLSINEENKGFRKNFMDSIRECSGEYLFLCDQDDIWNQDKISSMTKAMDENPKIDLLVSSLTYLRDGGVTSTLDLTTVDTPIEEDKEVFQLGLPKNILNVPFPGCTYCLRKSFVEECLPYWNDVCPHDALFYRSALLKGSGYILNKPLIIWRRYNQSSWNKETQTINADTEKEWRKKELAEVILLLVYAEDLNLSTTTKETLNRNKNWISTRIDLYEKHYSKIFELLEYKNLYNMKGIIKDFLLTLGIYKK